MTGRDVFSAEVDRGQIPPCCESRNLPLHFNLQVSLEHHPVPFIYHYTILLGSGYLQMHIGAMGLLELLDQAYQYSNAWVS